MKTMEIKSHLNEVGPAWDNFSQEVMDYYGEGIKPLLMDIRMVFYEAVVNAIKHGHKEDGRILEFKYSIEKSSIDFKIIDTGTWI